MPSKVQVVTTNLFLIPAREAEAKLAEEQAAQKEKEDALLEIKLKVWISHVS